MRNRCTRVLVEARCERHECHSGACSATAYAGTWEDGDPRVREHLMWLMREMSAEQLRESLVKVLRRADDADVRAMRFGRALEEIRDGATNPKHVAWLALEER